jgi:hypothetical protein
LTATIPALERVFVSVRYDPSLGYGFVQVEGFAGGAQGRRESLGQRLEYPSFSMEWQTQL